MYSHSLYVRFKWRRNKPGPSISVKPQGQIRGSKAFWENEFYPVTSAALIPSSMTTGQCRWRRNLLKPLCCLPLCLPCRDSTPTEFLTVECVAFKTQIRIRYEETLTKTLPAWDVIARICWNKGSTRPMLMGSVTVLTSCVT